MVVVRTTSPKVDWIGLSDGSIEIGDSPTPFWGCFQSSSRRTSGSRHGPLHAHGSNDDDHARLVEPPLPVGMRRPHGVKWPTNREAATRRGFLCSNCRDSVTDTWDRAHAPVTRQLLLRISIPATPGDDARQGRRGPSP